MTQFEKICCEIGEKFKINFKINLFDFTIDETTKRVFHKITNRYNIAYFYIPLVRWKVI